MEPLTILAKYNYFQHLSETLIIGGVLFVIFVITMIVVIFHDCKKKRQRRERLKYKNKKNDIES